MASVLFRRTASVLCYSDYTMYGGIVMFTTVSVTPASTSADIAGDHYYCYCCHYSSHSNHLNPCFLALLLFLRLLLVCCCCGCHHYLY